MPDPSSTDNARPAAPMFGKEAGDFIVLPRRYDAPPSLGETITTMRFGDPKLTMKIYTDASQLALSDSMAKLPAIGVHVGQRACNE